jgi:seryl-tRNA synthetase
MLDIDFIRTHADLVKSAVRRKGFEVDIDRLLAVDAERRAGIVAVDTARQERKTLSATIARLSGAERDATVARAQALRDTITEREAKLAEIEAAYTDLMLRVPNVPLPQVPDGHSDADNVEIRRFGEPTVFDFPAKDHVELAESLGLADFERPRLFAGSRAYALRAEGVLLEQALIAFALRHVISKGFIAYTPPIMVRQSALEGTGFFPCGKEDTYALERDDMYLCGTSEVGLVSLYREQILSHEELPVRMVGLSPCFRREAGASGKDTRGLYRVYQFTKVEQVVLCENSAEASLREHELLLQNSEEILRALGIPHRVALACAGELGVGQVLKHEVESWMPSRKAYGETHSCSSLHEFQSRRSMIRYRDAGKVTRPVHTLNNTAIASPRILIPILENFQQADGSVIIPEPLRPYLDGRERLVPRNR